MWEDIINNHCIEDFFQNQDSFVHTFGAKKSSVMSQKAMDPIPVYSNRDLCSRK